MKPMYYLLVVALLSSTFLKVVAQTCPPLPATAYDLATQAFSLLDNSNNYEQALNLLLKAARLEPKNTHFQYEIAYIYFHQKKYKKVITTLKKIINLPTALAPYYQLYGAALEELNKTEEAEKIYTSGIQKFPDSGELYTELGAFFYKKGNNDKAVEYWENGVKNVPRFATNYYWLSNLFCQSSEKMWGLIYGEIFCNLEPNSKRSIDIGMLMYNTYCQAITSDSIIPKIVVSKRAAMIDILFAQDTIQKAKLFPIVFQNLISKQFEQVTQNNLPNKTLIKPEMIMQLRQNFVKEWFKSQSNTCFPNPVLDYQKKILEQNHFEAYNYWLLGRHSSTNLLKHWASTHKITFQLFVEWYNKNPLVINKQNYFCRLNYIEPDTTNNIN